jgi:hypothetical protein
VAVFLVAVDLVRAAAVFLTSLALLDATELTETFFF